MVLRRLFSGWLIAMATLARSMALVLERVAADRSERASGPASDPVMAALVDQYPGAPAHWLAHLAERTSRMAEAGQVPLSLTSEEAAWPVLRPPVLAEPPARTSAVLGPDGEPWPRESVETPAPPPPPLDTVPSVAALQNRPSEIWRRPEARQGRRSRPVFAPATPSVRPGATVPGATFPGATSQRCSPMSLPAPRPVAAGTSPDVGTSPDPAQGTAGLAERPSAIDAESRPLDLAPQASASPTSATPSPHVTATDSRDESRGGKRRGDADAPAPPVGRQGFAAAPPLATSARQAPLFAEAAQQGSAIAPPPSSTTDAARPKRPVSWSFPGRSAARRPIFRTSAAREAARRSGDPPSAPPAPSRPSALPGTPAATAHPSADLITRPLPAAPAPAEAAKREPARAPAFASQDIAVQGDRPPIPRPAPWAPYAARDSSLAVEDAAPPQRPNPATYPSPLPATAAPHPILQPAIDDRWPSFPPAVISPPQAAGVPSPRLDQLARDQEEGRWSV